MTGIFQIFDRYKSKALVRNERRKSNSGEPEIKTIPTYYLVEEDGVPRKVVPDSSRGSETSRDSRRSSSAEVSEVVVKNLTTSKEPPKTPTGARVASSLEPPGDAAIATKPVASRASVDNNNSNIRSKLPPRSGSTRRTETSSVPDDARELSRAILQIREAANKSPYGAAEQPRSRHSPSVATRKDQRYNNQSSGDEQEAAKFHRYQSSGDEKPDHGYRHQPPREAQARRYSSATTTEQHFGVDDERVDHHRPQFPFEAKDFLRHQKHASSQNVREIARYMSSGDEMERRSNMSNSGDEFRFHRERRSHDQESMNRSHWLVGQRQPEGESSGDERVLQRPHSSSSRRQQHAHKQQQHYGRSGSELHSSGDEMTMNPHRHTPRRNASMYYSGHRSHQEPVEYQRYQSGGEEYRHHSASKASSRPSTSGYEGRRYQSSGDERGGGGGGHRSSRRHHAPALVVDHGWRNESSDEDREFRRSSVDARRPSDAHRRYSVGNDDGHRYSSANERRDRSSRSGSNHWGGEEATTSATTNNFFVPETGHRRNSSVESRGEHRRRGSSSSVVSNKGGDSRKLHEPRVSKPKVTTKEYSRDLPPRARNHSTVSPRNMLDIRDLAKLNVQVREGSKTPAEPPKVLPPEEPLSGSCDFREMLRAIDFKDPQWTSTRNSVDGRDPPRTSNVSRVSVDSRQYQSSTPRLSVDGREHLRASSLHSSRASSVDAQVQLRTNSMDSSSTSGEYKRRGPSVVARLMGLAELPEKDSLLQPQGKSLQKMLSFTPPAESEGKTQLHLSEVAQQMKQVAARLHQDSQLRQKSETRPKRKSSKTKSRTQSRSRSPPPPPPPAVIEKDVVQSPQGYGIFGRQLEPGSPLPRQPMSPKHHQMEGMPNVFKKRANDLASGDLDQRLHQLRIKNSIQEHRTLKQILEAMHLKGLLHPPQKKTPKSPLREEAEQPLEQQPNKRASFQEQLNFEDLIRMEGADDPEDHSGEASIVVMKPVNAYHSAMPPATTKEVDVNSESAAFEREKLELGLRRRGADRRAGSSGKISRSHSLEPLEQRSTDKVPVEDLSFANVMLSWRERIAADAAKKATSTVDIAEVKPLSSRSKTKHHHRSQEASPSSTTRTTADYERNVLSDIGQKNAEEDRLRQVIINKSSELPISAKLPVVEVTEPASTSDRVPAQVAVLRSKRASGGKSSRSKEKLRAVIDMPVSPSISSLETSTKTPPGSLASLDSKAEAEDSHVVKTRKLPKKRKIADVPSVTESVVLPEGTLEADAPIEEDDDSVPIQCSPEAAEEPQEDAKMEDAFDETLEAHTPEGFSSSKCFSDEGAFSLQGADHLSPVSVLDSPIFQEGFHLEELSTSPDSVKSILVLHEDAKETLDQTEQPETEALTPRSRASKDDPLREAYTKVARLIELGAEEDQEPYRVPSSSPSDQSEGKLYVQGILLESGLTDVASTLTTTTEAAAAAAAAAGGEIMEFDVFTRKEEELQTAELERIDRGELEKTEEKRYKESLDRRLVFDCMNEILERKMSPFLNPQPWGAPVVRRKPCGQRLVDEVWDELRDMHWPTSVAYDALYAVLQKDFMRKGFQWLDFSVEVGEVGCELECMILQELVEEVVVDLKNFVPKLVEAPSEKVVVEQVCDESEVRRRELLDKTRRDLLAWHVQYQQL